MKNDNDFSWNGILIIPDELNIYQRFLYARLTSPDGCSDFMRWMFSRMEIKDIWFLIHGIKLQEKVFHE